MTQAVRTSGIMPKRQGARPGLSVEEVFDDLRILVPNGHVALVLEPSYGQARRVAVDPVPRSKMDSRVSDALATWMVGYASRLRAPRVPEWLRNLLPTERVVIVPIRWGNWLAGAFAIDAQWLEEGHIAALQDMASSLAVKIATDDWAARNEDASAVIVRLPRAVAS